MASPKQHSPRVPTPGRRDRKAQDALWLAKLREDGVANHIPTPPEPPTELVKGIEEFNQTLFFECHETLENLWRVTPYPLRLFYQGLIKAAVGFLHITRHNRRGAVGLLSGALVALEPFPPQFMGVDNQELKRSVSVWLEAVSAGTTWDELLSSPFPKMVFHSSEE